MRSIRFWLPPIIGFLIIPAMWLLLPYTISSGADHAGAGLGQLLVLYPIPMLIVFSSKTANDAWLLTLALAVALIQFPLYGFIISCARLKKALWLKILAGIAWVHVIAAVAFMIILAIQAAL